MSTAAPAAATAPSPRRHPHRHRRWCGSTRCPASASPSTPARSEPDDPSTTAPVREREIKLVEFYAGMGTMRWSLERALESDAGAVVTALASIDNSEVANAVYLANYPHEDASGVLMRRNVEHLSSVPSLDAKFGGADVWTLSPPCQPYTRKGKQLHGDDPTGPILHRHSRVLTPTRSAPGTDTGGKRRRFRGFGNQKRARRRAGRGRVRLARVPRVPGGHRSPVHQGQVLLTGQAKATCVRGRRPSSTKFRPRRRERRVRRRG